MPRDNGDGEGPLSTEPVAAGLDRETASFMTCLAVWRLVKGNGDPERALEPELEAGSAGTTAFAAVRREEKRPRYTKY